jgi:hypothetical protein
MLTVPASTERHGSTVRSIRGNETREGVEHRQVYGTIKFNFIISAFWSRYSAHYGMRNSISMLVFWAAKLCGHVRGYSTKVSEEHAVSVLKTEAERFSETLEPTYKFAQR